MTKVLGGLILCTLLLGVRGQSIEGKVEDELNLEPLIGATVSVIGENIGTTTDENGYFILEDLSPGRFEIEVSFVGYQSRKISDILVKSGKIEKVSVLLLQAAFKLDALEVQSSYQSISPGRRTITEEQINRYAASYYDPARLMATSPDVSISNDQNNEVSVRGISPNYNVWRLEGVEVVNPNHLSNAGTPNDQPAGTSGGVNVLSAQMLAPSSFEYGVFNNSLGNSIGGIFDMNLKTGTATDYQFTTQASLIGFDLSAEGPFSQDSKASFITNYRYSFTGLLTNMGVDFGGESIGFQDLAVTANLPFRESGGVKIFGVGGTNFNHFNHLDFDDSEREKDRKDIYYEGNVGLIGASLDRKGFRGSVAYSGFTNSREETVYDNLDAPISDTIVNRDETILSTHLNYQTSIGQLRYTFGIINNFYQYNDVKEGLSQLFFNIDASFSRLYVTGGLTLSSNDLNETVFDPRIRLSFALSDRIDLFAGAGRFSQLLKPDNYFFSDPDFIDSYYLLDNYDFIISDKFSVGAEYTSGSFSTQIEAFYNFFSDINYLTTENADTKGVSITIQRDFVNQWYVLGGLTLFDSKINDDINNPYNLRQTVNVATGKDFRWIRKDVPRSLTVNARFTWQGGSFYTLPFGSPADPLRLIAPNMERLPDYLRTDLRVQWTKSRPNLTRIVAIDIQNTLNRENVGFIYYDSFLNSNEKSFQLGLIPILTYRLEF